MKELNNERVLFLVTCPTHYRHCVPAQRGHFLLKEQLPDSLEETSMVLREAAPECQETEADGGPL